MSLKSSPPVWVFFISLQCMLSIWRLLVNRRICIINKIDKWQRFNYPQPRTSMASLVRRKKPFFMFTFLIAHISLINKWKFASWTLEFLKCLNEKCRFPRQLIPCRQILTSCNIMYDLKKNTKQYYYQNLK